jgi:molecular chaperone HscA
MVIHVVQGEREMTAQNRSLARFTLSGIPPLPAGIARVKVTFAVDADGLLTVSAREERTGIAQSVHVKPSWGLAEEEIERMLRDSMVHARQDILERLLAEARVDAERAIAETESALKMDGHLLPDAEKSALRAQIALLAETMKSDRREEIDAMRETLHHEARPFAELRMNAAIAKALGGVHIDDAVSPATTSHQAIPIENL